jgi:hypothetical protein
VSGSFRQLPEEQISRVPKIIVTKQMNDFVLQQCRGRGERKAREVSASALRIWTLWNDVQFHDVVINVQDAELNQIRLVVWFEWNSVIINEG